VARMLECDRSKVSRIETGHRGIRGKELRELLAEYGVADKEQAVLELLANPRTGRGWFQDYNDVLRGAWRDYLTLETAASKISVYEAQRVPGLLQTRAYARALAEADPSWKDNAERHSAVEATLSRRRAILRKGGPKLHLIIGQAALRLHAGSAAVMEEQLRALEQAAEDSGAITVQVLPFDAGPHAATGEGALTILQFDQAPDLGLVHLGAIGGGVCLEAQNDLGSYTRAFERLSGCALSPKRSALMLRDIAGFPRS
jgi:hypothetical protein